MVHSPQSWLFPAFGCPGSDLAACLSWLAHRRLCRGSAVSVAAAESNGRLGGVACPGQRIIALLTLILAVLVGMQFPLANRREFDGTAGGAARLYTADFIGACLGALLACTLLIPLIGVTGVCLLTALLNVAGALAGRWRTAAA